MPTALDSASSLTDEVLTKMIADAERTYKFLKSTPQTLRAARLMRNYRFMFDDRQTPVVASFEFLKHRAAQDDPRGGEFDLSDFVFAIKMFGLQVFERKGMKYFLGRNMPAGVRRVREGKEDKYEPVPLNDADSVRKLEFNVFQGGRTKIQINEIQSATNKLLREYRELLLANHLGKLRASGLSIGDCRDRMRSEHSVKDHEFARVRTIAIELGVFKPGRAAAKESSRVMLDPDVQEFLGRVRAEKKAAGARENQLSMSKLLNNAVRELHLIATGEPLPRATRALTVD
ncbi:hypothetical protein [Cupriavidus pampae]|jgi:hypothetical protein|uniref:Uncharacterized protein n=1 Tax=Cupriavidus pampae TaxID=659251 RepID=A0ABN7ZDV7_9BURK|nr:hypothetical protein [Cupriavidus pampae]CAG9184145.1 hypothetical protein LMG32289_05537 [Cupriavidus pampae]